MSGVTGDGEREQAVTEEEDMAALREGKGEVRYGFPLSPVQRNYQSESRSPGPGRKARDRFPETFPMAKYS